MMSRWLLTGIVVLAVIVALPLAARLMRPREGRDKRYQISLDCFDRLPGLNFKQRLKQN